MTLFATPSNGRMRLEALARRAEALGYMNEARLRGLDV
jgi:hypothetical protein